MSLSDLAALGSFASGIVVLVSLVYLSLQIRQSARNQQATIQQQRASLVQDVVRRAAAADMIEIATRGSLGDSTLDLLSSLRYEGFALQCLWLYEEYFYQHQEGMLNKAGWATNVRRLRLQLRAPGFRAAWRAMSEWFEPDFAAFVNGLMRDATSERGLVQEENWGKFATEEVEKQGAIAASR